MNNYEDIINIENYNPKYHERMSIENRAAQFAPFSALTGFYEKITDKEKIKENRKILSDENKKVLDEKIYLIENDKNICPEITFYSNYEYKRKKNIVKKIDRINKRILLIDKSVISIEDIIDIKISQ